MDYYHYECYHQDDLRDGSAFNRAHLLINNSRDGWRQGFPSVLKKKCACASVRWPLGAGRKPSSRALVMFLLRMTWLGIVYEKYKLYILCFSVLIFYFTRNIFKYVALLAQVNNIKSMKWASTRCPRIVLWAVKLTWWNLQSLSIDKFKICLYTGKSYISLSRWKFPDYNSLCQNNLLVLALL